MRRFPFLLTAALLGLGASPARAQQPPAPASGPPAAAPAVASAPAPAPAARVAPATAPVAGAPAAAAAPAEPPAAEPYDPAAHGGTPYGTYLLATRGTVRRSTGMMVTGIVLTGISAIVMGVGTGIYAGGGNCVIFDAPTPGGVLSQSCQNSGPHTTGMAILVAGTIGVGLGIPLWIAGASDVPRREATRAAPTVIVGSTGGALRWEF